MNMMMVDVTHLSSVKSGEEVVLIGKSGEEYLSAETLAEWARTIHYELVTRLPSEIKRNLT